MITDRTLQDVENAILIRNKKVKTFQSLTEEDINVLEKGLVTIVTLNRVEQKQAELKNLLNSIGYWNTPIINKEWSYEQIFDDKELERLFNNNEILKKAFYVYSNTPDTPQPSYFWDDWNSIEKILVDTESMINQVKNGYKYCASIECGEE